MDDLVPIVGIPFELRFKRPQKWFWDENGLLPPSDLFSIYALNFKVYTIYFRMYSAKILYTN